MTNIKKPNNPPKRHNLTGHDRAMTDAEVKNAFGALKSSLNSLSGEEQGNRFRKLVDSGCSIRGLGRDLGIPPTTVKRYMKLAETLEANSDWSVMLDTLAPCDTTEETKLSSIEAARESKAEFERNKAMMLANAHQAKVPPASKTGPPNNSRITSKSAKESHTVNDRSYEKEISAEDPPKKNLSEQFMQARQNGHGRLRVLVSMDVEPRPIRNAHSLKRQGRPLPPKDRV